MKYIPAIYAQALLAALDNVPSKQHPALVERFVRLIFRLGDWLKRDQIVKAVKEQMTKRQGGRTVKIEVARPAATHHIQSLMKLFLKPDQVEVVTNPSLVAGVRLTVDQEKELDLSLQRKLRKLFSSSFFRQPSV